MHTILNNMMKSHTIQLHPTQDPQPLTSSVPDINHRHLHGSMIQVHPKQMILLLMYCQKVSNSLMLWHSAYIIPLTSSHHIGVLLSHIITRRVTTVQ